MKTFLLPLIAACFASSSYANCLIDRGPYQDGSGFANFPFSNTCDQNVMVSLCVKTYAGGETRFTPYTAIVNRQNNVNLIAGRWSTFDSYRWSEGQKTSCPFF